MYNYEMNKIRYFLIRKCERQLLFHNIIYPSLPICKIVYCHRLQYTEIQCEQSETYCTGQYQTCTNHTQTSPGVPVSLNLILFITRIQQPCIAIYSYFKKWSLFRKENKISFINFLPVYSFVCRSVRVRSYCEPYLISTQQGNKIDFTKRCQKPRSSLNSFQYGVSVERKDRSINSVERATSLDECDLVPSTRTN